METMGGAQLRPLYIYMHTHIHTHRHVHTQASHNTTSFSLHAHAHTRARRPDLASSGSLATAYKTRQFDWSMRSDPLAK